MTLSGLPSSNNFNPRLENCKKNMLDGTPCEVEFAKQGLNSDTYKAFEDKRQKYNQKVEDCVTGDLNAILKGFKQNSSELETALTKLERELSKLEDLQNFLTFIESVTNILAKVVTSV